MDAEAQAELAEIARSLRAHLEWQRVTGTTELPRGDGSEWATAEPAVEPARERAAEPAPSALRAAEPTPSALRAAEPAPSALRAAAPAPSAPALDTPPADVEARRVRLAMMEQEIRGCTACALSAGRKQTVFARGSFDSGLCFVGEGPGADEDAQGYPFVGMAGQLLDRMITAMGFLREEVYVCNIVKCRPPNNRKPEPLEMAACSAYLREQLELVAPQVIVALGATAVQGLLGTTDGITRLRGKWKLYQGRVPVMPTFHPAYLLRTPSAKRDVWDDLQAVLRQMGRAPPERSR